MSGTDLISWCSPGLCRCSYREKDASATAAATTEHAVDHTSCLPMNNFGLFRTPPTTRKARGAGIRQPRNSPQIKKPLEISLYISNNDLSQSLCKVEIFSPHFYTHGSFLMHVFCVFLLRKTLYPMWHIKKHLLDEH